MYKRQAYDNVKQQNHSFNKSVLLFTVKRYNIGYVFLTLYVFNTQASSEKNNMANKNISFHLYCLLKTF